MFKNIPYLDKAANYMFYLDKNSYNTKKIVNLVKEITAQNELVMNLATHFIKEGEKNSKQKWFAEGKFEGKTEGKTEEKTEIAINMLQSNLTFEFIAKCTGLEILEIKDLYLSLADK